MSDSQPISRAHLVDGTYELFRAHFGAPSATAPDGQEVGAVRGFLRSMHALLRQDDVTHVGIAFDSQIESFRNQLFDGYKTGEGLDPELFAQFPLAERAAAALGMHVWPMIEFEADDALASAAEFCHKSGQVKTVVIASPDKDLAQCVVDSQVICLDRARKRSYDRNGVLEKFGVAPESIPDYLALVGDSADGIPGVPGWGSKSTATVLAHYHHLDEIPDDSESWQVQVRGAKRLATNLTEHRKAALLYRQLATLRRDAPLAIDSPEQLRWPGANRQALEQLCAEIGDERFAASVTLWAD